jgi:hypothetical protein
MVSSKVHFPLPWREGMKGRGKDMIESIYLPPPPEPSPIEGEGILDF